MFRAVDRFDFPSRRGKHYHAAMSEIDRIVDQLRRAWEGEAWHGPSVREALAGITAEHAAARPISDAHSIWEIALHIGAWEDIVRRRLSGEAVNATPEMDWPPVTATDDDAWAGAQAELERIHRGLVDAIAAFDASKLDHKPAGGSTAYVLMHGAIQHDLYHSGQIVILRKGAKSK
jgi:uncharacterized damage-inducible protein DinB